MLIIFILFLFTFILKHTLIFSSPHDGYSPGPQVNEYDDYICRKEK